MKKNLFLFALLLFAATMSAQNGIIGKWKTIDDETGKAKSVVEIYEKSGKIYGKIIELLDTADKNKTCEACLGEDKGKPILALTIIKGLQKDGSDYSNGKILDPKNGKLYKCTITLEEKDKLKVRGYIGFSVLGRSQFWSRVK